MDQWDIRPIEPEPAPVEPESPSVALLHSARRGVQLLRISAGVIFVVGLVGQIGLLQNQDYYAGGQDTPFSLLLWQFLQGMVMPLGFAALALSASVVVQVMAARIALMAGEPVVAPPKRVDTSGDLIVKAPPRSPSKFATKTAPIGDDAIWRPRESVD